MRLQYSNDYVICVAQDHAYLRVCRLMVNLYLREYFDSEINLMPTASVKYALAESSKLTTITLERELLA